MHFDDVNYEMYNKYIFSLDPVIADQENPIEVQEAKSLIGSDENYLNRCPGLDEDTSVMLTEKDLKLGNFEDFKHDEVNTLTEEEKDQMLHEKLEENE